MNGGSVSVDAENATTHNPHGIILFSDEGGQYEVLRGTSRSDVSHQKKKGNNRKTSPRCPNRKLKRACDANSESLIHRAILEGSKGGSRKSIGRFAHQVFLSLRLPRVIRVHKGPLFTYGIKDENWKLFALAQALTVTASARAKAREDSRTDSTKRPVAPDFVN